MDKERNQEDALFIVDCSYEVRAKELHIHTPDGPRAFSNLNSSMILL